MSDYTPTNMTHVPSATRVTHVTCVTPVRDPLQFV